MNPFFAIILVAILLEYVINLVADILNLRALKLEIPATLQGIYKPDEYRNSQQYTSTVTRFDFVTSSFRLALLLAFWFGGGFNYLDQNIRSWGFVPIANGLLYIGILLFAYSLITLPFSIYTTFVIEERFGFNRTTPIIFIKDRLKGLALTLLLGTPLLAIVLALFEYAGYYAWHTAGQQLLPFSWGCSSLPQHGLCPYSISLRRWSLVN